MEEAITKIEGIKLQCESSDELGGWTGGSNGGVDDRSSDLGGYTAHNTNGGQRGSAEYSNGGKPWQFIGSSRKDSAGVEQEQWSTQKFCSSYQQLGSCEMILAGPQE